MSEAVSFEQSVVDAADCYVEAYGLDGAIVELQARREAGGDNGRVNEALAYLKRRAADE